jgi:tetratricopeptide (TPR) repeat protein
MNDSQQAFEFDVFVSYRWVEPDQTWVRNDLVPALQAAGLRVCLDVNDFVPGRDLMLEMTRAGKTSRKALCVLSEAYFEGNRMVHFESLAARRDDPSGLESRLIPLVFRPSLLPEWLRGLIPVDWTDPSGHSREWGKLLKVLDAPDVSRPPTSPTIGMDSHRNRLPGDERIAPIATAREQARGLDLELAAVALTAGRLDAAEAALRRILRTTPNDVEANYRLARIYLVRGRLSEAEDALQRVRSTAVDEPWRARALVGLGDIKRRLGGLDDAEKLFREALALNERLSRDEGISSCYRCLGELCQARDDLDGAEALYEDALTVSQRLNDADGLAAAHTSLGNVMALRRHLDKADAQYRNALKIQEDAWDQAGVATSCGNLGILLASRGDTDEAEKAFQRALAIFVRLGEVEGMANQYSNLGSLMRMRKDFSDSERMFRQALKLEERIGRIEGRARVHANLGGLIQARCWEHPSTRPEEGAEAARREFISARDLYAQLGSESMATRMQEYHDSVRPVYAFYSRKPPEGPSSGASG